MSENTVKSQVKTPAHRLISVIGWQAVVLLTVLYATVEANSIAGSLVSVYAWLVGIVGIMYVVITFVPQRVLQNSDKLKDGTPDITGKVARGIGTAVSLIEIVLFIQYDFPVIAAIWTLVEIFQYAAYYRIRKAVEFNAQIDATYEAVIAKHFENPESKSLKIQVLESTLEQVKFEIEAILNEMPDNDARKLAVSTMQNRYKDLKAQYVAQVMKENEIV